MIELRVNNLYSNGTVVEFDNGEQILIRDRLSISQFSDFKFHTFTDEEELTMLAYKYYNFKVKDASKYWWLIADVNNIMNPFDLDYLIGIDIYIPNILELKNIINE